MHPIIFPSHNKFLSLQILRDGGGEAMRRAARWALIFITVSALLGRGAAQLPPADAPSNDTREFTYALFLTPE